MMLPKKLQVGFALYSVEVVDEQPLYKRRKVRGLCNYTTKHITIWGGQTKRMILSTFWHELLHALSHEYRIALHHPRIFDLELRMADLFLANPQLRRVIPTWRPQRAKRDRDAG